jgi:hypothetical protein
LIAGLVFAALPAAANVDVSRTLQFPKIEGLSIASDLPAEVNRRVESATYSVRIGAPAVDALLEKAGLPARVSSAEERSETPQCKVWQAKRELNAELVLNDKFWLKNQSWWCRAARTLFGTCKPDSYKDVALYATLRIAADKVSDGEGKVEPVPPLACVPDAEGDAERMANALKYCAGTGAPVGGFGSCATATQEMWSKLTRSSDKKTWTMPLAVYSQRFMREKLAPLVNVTVKSTELVTLAIAGTPLARLPDATGYEAALSFDDLLRLGSSRADLGAVDVTGTYQTTANGVKLGDAHQVSKPLATTFEAKRLNNRPALARIGRGEILGVEEHVGSDEAEKAKAAQFYEWCVQNSNRLSEFGRFMCGHGYQLVEILPKKVQARVKFLDQDGVERLVTWERKAPSEDCRYAGYQGFTCYIHGTNESAWAAWLYGARENEQLKQIFSDPSFGPETQVVFADVFEFLPKAAGSAPLTSFVSPQTRSLRIESGNPAPGMPEEGLACETGPAEFSTAR